MNRFKAEVHKQQLSHILVYADEAAISFFHSQGFSHRLSLPPASYKGIIGEYNGSVLMECELHSEIPYSRLPRLIRLARESLLCGQPGPGQLPNGSAGRLKGMGSCESQPGVRKQGGRRKDAKLHRGVVKRGRSGQQGVQQGQVSLGEHLAKALLRAHQELADPQWLSTDLGSCGVGTRLVPMALGHMAFSGQSCALGDAVGSALQDMMGLPTLDAVHFSALYSTQQRRQCRYYSDAPQLLADLHRKGLASFALHDGPLRAALALTEQARSAAARVWSP